METVDSKVQSVMQKTEEKRKRLKQVRAIVRMRRENNESMENTEEKAWYMSENIYNTLAVKWILNQDKGADVFIFYQKLFVHAVQLDVESIPYHEINPKGDKFIDYALKLLLKVDLIQEEDKDGVVWINVPDNDVLRRKI